MRAKITSAIKLLTKTRREVKAARKAMKAYIRSLKAALVEEEPGDGNHCEVGIGHCRMCDYEHALNKDWLCLGCFGAVNDRCDSLLYA